MHSTALESPANQKRLHGAFPAVPASWFYFCRSQELDRRPIRLELCGRSFVGYRTASGNAVVLSGRCCHLGADLGQGTVVGDRLVCPLHGWEFGPGGQCERIPSGEGVPGFARQQAFAVAERAGHVFFFNRPEPRFPLPFFEEMAFDQLLPARPFELVAEAPWYFIGANGFDVQHFRMAHDRTLIGQPLVSSPSPFCRRVLATFAVSGTSIQDRLTRLVAGPRVEMDVASWCGSMILVRARFARTTSFGIFNVLPMDASRTRGRVIVWVRRSRTALARIVFDPLNASIRRRFIRTFLRSDLPRIAGLRYQPGHLIAADEVLADYFAWLANVAEPSPTGNP